MIKINSVYALIMLVSPTFAIATEAAPSVCTTALADQTSRQLTVVPAVNSGALMTEFMTTSISLMSIDINNAEAVEKGTKFFQDYGRSVLKQLGEDNPFLDGVMSDLEKPGSAVEQVTSNVMSLSQMVQDKLDPVTLKKIRSDVVHLDGAHLLKGLRQMMAKRMKSVALDNITNRQAFADIAMTLTRAVDQLDHDRVEIGKIQAHLRQVRAALEALSSVGNMAEQVFKGQIEGLKEEEIQRKDVLIRTNNRFNKVLTQLSEGATLAAQLEKVWGLMAESYNDAIESGNDAVLIALPAHKAVEAARTAQARARRVQAASAMIQQAKSLALSELAKELGQGETERQKFKIDWLEQTVASFEEMSIALIDVETRRTQFEREYGEKLRVARVKMDDTRIKMDRASVELIALPAPVAK